MFEGKEEEAMIGEDEETKHCVPEEREDVGYCANPFTQLRVDWMLDRISHNHGCWSVC